MSEAKVREAFISQAGHCDRLGSPFTGALCRALAVILDRKTLVGRRILDWPGNPAASGDGVPLRLCGGLHALVRSGAAGALDTLYPPAPLPDQGRLEAVVADTLVKHDAWLDPWLDNAPQTNEVGRSAPLMAGLLAVADQFRLPMRIYELGASAGLNLQLDRFGYELGGHRFGDLKSSVQLRPHWRGSPPPKASIEIVGRSGVDINPMDPAQDGDRLLAYIWPDQPERLKRTQAALELARKNPVRISQADAADWIEGQLSAEPTLSVVQLVFHSLAFQYFPEPVQARVEACIASCGRRATADAPLAWLRFEMLPGDASFSLRLRTWPGEDRLLAWVHPHGSEVDWL